MDALSRACSGIWLEDKNFLAPFASCTDHPFAQAELHLAWLQVGNADDQLSDEVFWFVSRLDSREDVFPDITTQTESQLKELVSTFDMIGFDDTRDTKVDFHKVFNRTLFREWFVCERFCGIHQEDLCLFTGI